MPRINLLPTSKNYKLASIRQSFYKTIIIFMITIIVLFLWYQSLEVEIDKKKKDQNILNLDIKKFSKGIKQIKLFEKQQNKIKSRIDIIDSLEVQRLSMAKILDTIAVVLNNEGHNIWLVNLKEEDGIIYLTGGAKNAEDISDFQIELQRYSLFKKTTLKKFFTKKTKEFSYISWDIICETIYVK